MAPTESSETTVLSRSWNVKLYTIQSIQNQCFHSLVVMKIFIAGFHFYRQLGEERGGDLHAFPPDYCLLT